jgi:hypothetical protein
MVKASTPGSAVAVGAVVGFGVGVGIGDAEQALTISTVTARQNDRTMGSAEKKDMIWFSLQLGEDPGRVRW